MPAGGAPSHSARSRRLGTVADTATKRTLPIACARMSGSLRDQGRWVLLSHKLLS